MRTSTTCALLMTVAASLISGQQLPVSISSLAARSWFVDFAGSTAQLAGADLVLYRGAEAAREGRFRDAAVLLKQAAEIDKSPSGQIKNLFFQRFVFNTQFSEIGGGYGAQRQLQLQRIDSGPEDLSLEIKLNVAIDRLPVGPEQEDARFAGKVFLLADACQNFLSSALRFTVDGTSAILPPNEKLCDISGVVGSGFLGENEKRIIQSIASASLSAAKGDTEAARQMLSDGRTAASVAMLTRSKAEFDLRLGDLYAVPHGSCMSLGYNLSYEVVARNMLDFGRLSQARSAPSDAMLAESAKWYQEAESLAAQIGSVEFTAEVKFREACATYVRGATPQSIPLFISAGDKAQQAGWMRGAALGWGIAAVLTSDMTRYRSAMSTFVEQGDFGAAASLVDMTESYAAILKFRGNLQDAIRTVLMPLRAITANGDTLLPEGLMSRASALYKQAGDSDRALYWARTAVEAEDLFLARSGKYFLGDTFLVSENRHLATLLGTVALEYFSRTLTEPDPNDYWSKQLMAVEKRMFIRDQGALDQSISQLYRQSTAELARKFSFGGRIARVASCQSGGYEALRDEVVQGQDQSALTDLNQYLAVCGDAAAIRAAKARLDKTDMAGLIQTMQANARRSNLGENGRFNAANNEFTAAVNTAMTLKDFAFAEKWLDEIEKIAGPTQAGYFTRLSLLLATHQGEQARVRAMRMYTDKTLWALLQQPDRLQILGGLAEAYAQAGNANQSLAALLTVWREQSIMNHEAPGAASQVVWQRAALLRMRPEELSTQQKKILLEMCLQDDASKNEPPLLADISQLSDHIPPKVTVLVYFVGIQAWLWRLERSTAPVLVPLATSQELGQTLMRFKSRFATDSETPGGEDESNFLYSKLVQPAGDIPRDHVIAIAGAGYFNGLSFDALGPLHGTLLGQQHPIVYVASLFGNDSPFATSSRKTAVVGSNNAALGEAIEEATDIARIVKSSVLLGTNVSKSELVRTLKTADWIHFATDGVIDTMNPYRSHLMFNNEQILGVEIPSLAASATMVVFSVCQSNVAPMVIGQGGNPAFARGLTMFAHAAGAKWVIATLWKANDAASHQIMIGYYRHLSAGESPGIALFHAKEQFIKDNPQRKGPWYWGGNLRRRRGMWRI